MLYKLFLILFLTATTLSCTLQGSSTSLYKAKGSQQNTPYDDNRGNNKARKEHDKKAKARQKELDHINHKDIDPEHPQQGK